MTKNGKDVNVNVGNGRERKAAAHALTAESRGVGQSGTRSAIRTWRDPNRTSGGSGSEKKKLKLLFKLMIKLIIKLTRLLLLIRQQDL